MSVDLGQLVLSNHKHNLQLVLTVSATASSFPSSQETSVASDSLKSSSEWLTSSSVWVCRGTGLRLILRVLIDGQPLEKSNLELLQRLWTQLHLRAVPPVQVDVTHSSSDDGHGGIIMFDISHDRANTVPQKHRLSAGVPFADIKPPAGVKTVGLEAVFLSMNITNSNRRRKKRNTAVQPRTQPIGLPAGNIELVPTECAALPLKAESGTWTEAHQPCEDLLDQPFDSLFCSQSSLVEDEAMLLDELSGHDTTSYHDNQQQLRIDPEATNNNQPRKRPIGVALDDGECPVHSTSVDMNHLVELIDSALRMSICDRPLRSMAGLKMKKDEMVTRLDTVSPSLWSPGYLQAVSQRAVFLPTISHALSRSVYTNTRSTRLRSKLEQLAHGLPVGEIDQPEDGSRSATQPPNSDVLSEALSVRLWRLLQTSLFDPNAARRLKPLKFPDNLEDVMTNDVDELFAQDSAPDLDAIYLGDLVDDDEDEENLFYSQEIEDGYDSDSDLLFEAGENDEKEYFSHARNINPSDYGHVSNPNNSWDLGYCTGTDTACLECHNGLQDLGLPSQSSFGIMPLIENTETVPHSVPQDERVNGGYQDMDDDEMICGV